MKKIKILYINTVETGSNGITSVLFTYLKGLEKYAYRYSIDYVAISRPEDLYKSYIKRKWGRMFILNRKGNPVSYYFKLKKIVKNGKYDIVHAHGNSRTLSLDMLASKSAKIRIAQGHSTSCSHLNLHKLLSNVFYKNYTIGLSVSEESGKFLFGDHSFKILLNAINTGMFRYNQLARDEFRAKFGLENKILIGSLGRISKEKNQLFMVQLIEKLVKINENYFLTILGFGSKTDETKLLNIIEKKKLNKNVLVLKNVDTSKYLSMLDVFIQPSLYEGFGLSIVEAEANGLNCIISESIPKSVDVTGKVKTLSLEKIEDWVKEIDNLDYSKRIDEALMMNDIVKASRFDIEKRAYELDKFYSECFEKESDLDE